jgi:hypothetical protein
MSVLRSVMKWMKWVCNVMVSNLAHGIFESFIGLLLSSTQTELDSRLHLTQLICLRKSYKIFYNEIALLKLVVFPAYCVYYRTAVCNKYSAVH